MKLYKVTYKLPVKAGKSGVQKNDTGLVLVSNYFNAEGLQDFIRRTPQCIGPINISLCTSIEL